jgi:uncharacterized protein (DUF433 family)
MNTLVPYPHLSVDAAGAAWVDGTRYKVLHLAGEHYHYGWSAEEILRQHPDLRPEQVYAALAYFYDRHESLVKQLREEADAGERDASDPPFSRSELLNRRAARGT